jgi:hypothetical protein
MTAYVDKVAVLRRERAVLLEECQQSTRSTIETEGPVSQTRQHGTGLRRDLHARLTALDVEILKLGADPLD